MKHMMMVGVIALIATGLSLTKGMGDTAKVRTPGLPAGWTMQGNMAGRDDVAVARPQDGAGPADLVLTRGIGALAGGAWTVFQTIDAAPWRGRTIVFSSYLRAHLEPEAMRQVDGGAIAELRIECDGQHPGVRTAGLQATRTRRWLEYNLELKVANDATRCSFGVSSMAPSELRLSRVQLQDRAAYRAALLAKRWPGLPPMPEEKGELRFSTGAALAAPQNLEFQP